MVDREDECCDVSPVFMMSFIAIVFILISLTFVTVTTRNKLRRELDHYSSSITQEEIDEAWEKFSKDSLDK